MIAMLPPVVHSPARMSTDRAIEITAMTPAHLDAARALWAETEGIEVTDGDSPDQLRRYLARNPGLSTVALDPSGALVGAVLCGHDGRRGWIYHLAVAQSQRGRGLGRALMRRSLEALRREDIVRALLLVAADNDGGHEFWLKERWEDMPFAKPMGIDL